MPCGERTTRSTVKVTGRQTMASRAGRLEATRRGCILRERTLPLEWNNWSWQRTEGRVQPQPQGIPDEVEQFGVRGQRVPCPIVLPLGGTLGHTLARILYRQRKIRLERNRRLQEIGKNLPKVSMKV